METLVISDLRDAKVNGYWTIEASIKATGDSSESKQVSLNINFAGARLKDVLDKAAQSTRISWANGAGGRKNFDHIEDRSTVEVDFMSPGTKTVSRAEKVEQAAVIFEAAGIDHDEAVKMANVAVDNL